ncbi:MAG: flagellar type III secretion system pore protein FliP [Spirochaetaceae bacterium]|nr:flagellar type III secretion system pore protein FliP [Spirochaetaceae bacterium]
MLLTGHFSYVFSQETVDQTAPPEDRTVQAVNTQISNGINIPFIDLSVRPANDNKEVTLSLQILIFLALLTLSPSILILMTPFLRIAIVFDFVKRALSLQQVPPTQVMMGVALFLTLFIMWPTIQEVNDNAFKPFSAGEIGLEELYTNSVGPLRFFMYNQMKGDYKNIQLFMKLRGLPKPANFSEVPTYVLIPAYVLNELTIAFKIGILLFIPFIVIDMVVASTLMSMGMIMLPPVMISMPFKIILFVLVDGWGLITQQLIAGFS